MKNLIFILLISVFFSCSGGDDDVVPDCWLSYPDHESFSPDSTYLFRYSGSYIYKYNGKLIKERPYYIHSETINTGYGKYNTRLFSNIHVNAFENTVAVIATPNENCNDNCYYNINMLITVYDYNLDSITSIFSENSYYEKWGWNNFLIVSKNKCDRYSERGKLLETINGISFPTIYPSDIILNDYTFVRISETIISKFSLKNGQLWVIKLNDEIENKPSTETNPPKFDIESYSISGTTLTINFNVTYYSGEKEIKTIKINSETGKII